MSRRRKRTLLILLLSTSLLTATGYGCYRHKFPYGWSHCCDKQISIGLIYYSETHDGWFPRGESSPEASLSLLYREEPGIAHALSGKIIPPKVVSARLESGELLSPETCGWHYVEGLHRNDNPELALFWDKVGLGHNGERLSRGGHMVFCIGSGHDRYVPADEWDQFLADQEKLRANIKRPPAPFTNSN